MKKGFDRLRGVAAASAIGVAGLVGGGSARAVTATLPLNVTVGSAFWTSIDNNTELMHGQSITTTGGFSVTSSMSGFAISDASITRTTPTSTTWSDFYDNGMSLAVGNVIFENPDATVDLTGNTVNTDVVVDIIPGVDAQLEYFFDPNRNVVRGLYTLTNTTGAAITTSALVMGNYGSDSDTTVQATSSGDLVVTDADMWVVSNDSGVAGDDSAAGSDPTATVASYGTGASVMPKTVITVGSPAGGASGEVDNYGYRYDMTIPAGATCRVMLFNEMSTSIADAEAGAADFESLTAADAAGLLSGIGPNQQATIVNYSAAGCAVEGGGGGVFFDDDDDDGLFALGVPGLLGMLGSLVLFRQRGRKDRQ